MNYLYLAFILVVFQNFESGKIREIYKKLCDWL